SDAAIPPEPPPGRRHADGRFAVWHSRGGFQSAGPLLFEIEVRAVLLLALAVLSVGGRAQTDSITVTGTRVERPSMEVPASIDRVEAEDIRFAKPQINLSESLGRVPGIVVQNRQNYAQDLQISSRGFGGRSTFGIRGLRLI